MSKLLTIYNISEKTSKISDIECVECQSHAPNQK